MGRTGDYPPDAGCESGKILCQIGVHESQQWSLTPWM